MTAMLQKQFSLGKIWSYSFGCPSFVMRKKAFMSVPDGDVPRYFRG